MRRIERLINLIAALLETHRPLSAEEIRTSIAGYDRAGTHEAFRRAFERDKQALRDMGIPLELRPLEPLGEAEGYIIPKDRYYLPALDLEPDELAALRIAAETLLGRRDEAGTGLLKLTTGTDAASWRGPRPIAGASLGVGDPQLGVLYSALLDRRPVEFSYEDAHGQRTARRVEPWGLVHRAGQWYLVGRDADADERRTFRIGRVQPGLKVLEGSYEIPPSGSDPSIGAEAWEFGSAEVTEVRVRFAPGARWWAEQNLDHLPRHDAPGGELDVDMKIGNDDALLGWIIEWGGEVTVVSPPELGRRLSEHLRPWREVTS